MKIPKPTKNEISILLAIVGCLLALIYIMLPRTNHFGIAFSLCLLVGSFAFLSGWIIGRDKKNGILEFLKILLPASVSILGTIWIFSSGYLNLRAENLKNDIRAYQKNIYDLEKKDSILKIKVSEFVADSTRLFKENNFMKEQITKLEGIVASYPEIERENARLKLANKIIPELQLTINRFNKLRRPYLSENLKWRGYENVNSNRISFHVKNQNGKSLSDEDITLKIQVTDDFDEYYPKKEITQFQFKIYEVPYNKRGQLFDFEIPKELMEIDKLPFAELFFNIKNYESKSAEAIKNANQLNGISILQLVGAEYKILVHN